MTAKPTKPTKPVALTWRGVTARRMARHALTEPAAGVGPAGIAELLCGAPGLRFRFLGGGGREPSWYRR